jgi:hypothetical protein
MPVRRKRQGKHSTAQLLTEKRSTLSRAKSTWLSPTVQPIETDEGGKHEPDAKATVGETPGSSASAGGSVREKRAPPVALMRGNGV